jgi:hypothetical protein
MTFHELMELTQILPTTASEKATAAADVVGITVTTLWLAGWHLAVDAWLHTAIGVVTFASVTFSLGHKIYTAYKQNKK